MTEKRNDCELEFSRIWKRFDEGNARFDKLQSTDTCQQKDISALQANMIHLVDSLKALTTAMWGVMVSIMLAGLGFIIWYVQNGNH